LALWGHAKNKIGPKKKVINYFLPNGQKQSDGKHTQTNTQTHSLYSLKEQAKGSHDSTTDMKLLQCFMHPNLLHKF